MSITSTSVADTRPCASCGRPVYLERGEARDPWPDRPHECQRAFIDPRPEPDARSGSITIAEPEPSPFGTAGVAEVTHPDGSSFTAPLDHDDELPKLGDGPLRRGLNPEARRKLERLLRGEDLREPERPSETPEEVPEGFSPRTPPETPQEPAERDDDASLRTVALCIAALDSVARRARDWSRALPPSATRDRLAELAHRLDAGELPGWDTPATAGEVSERMAELERPEHGCIGALLSCPELAAPSAVVAVAGELVRAGEPGSSTADERDRWLTIAAAAALRVEALDRTRWSIAETVRRAA